MKLSERDVIESEAYTLGFSLFGIAKAEELVKEYENFTQWLELGYHGELGYMSREPERRKSVQSLLPDCKSVIVVAQNYFTPFHHVPDEIGKISRYSWGDDYHDVMKPKLLTLAEKVRSVFPNDETKVYTDTGALLEKSWAVRAGIGWQGKHSNIINRTIGSWFFIGIVLTTAELSTNYPHRDFCGSCTACINACPTQAIVQPYVVDARKCISYHTIEMKPHHEIPVEIAENLDGWLFGCDVCQEVCPWNRFETPTTEEAFLPRNNEIAFSPIDIISLRQEDFSVRFRKSPLKRTKLAGLQRNAHALLTNIQENSSENDPY